MSGQDLIHFGDVVYFSTSSVSGEEQIWTGLFDRPRRLKLVPKSEITEPMIALFMVDSYGKDSAEELRGQVVKPGAAVQLLNIVKQTFVSWSDGAAARELAFNEKPTIPLFFSVYTKRACIGAGVKEGDELAIQGQLDDSVMTLSNDFWFMGMTDDKWVIHKYDETTKEMSEVRYGQVCRLRASNNMFLSVKPNFENSDSFMIPEEQQSPDCLSNPEEINRPEYCGTLRADLTTDEEDANNYWTPEREDSFKGGLLKSEGGFYLHHIASGKFLAADLSLVARAKASFFVFISADGAGNIGFGESLNLVNTNGSVVSLDSSPAPYSIQAQLFQKVASDLPRDAEMRQALVSESARSVVESLKFEVRPVQKSQTIDAVLLATNVKPLSKCRIALQNISKLENPEKIFAAINKEMNETFFRMGDKSLVAQANAASDMQVVCELLRTYLLKRNRADFKDFFSKLEMFSQMYPFYSVQYHDRSYSAMMARKKMLATMITTMPIETTDIIGYGLIRATPAESMRLYWTEFCMTLTSVDKNAENYFEIAFFLQRLLIGLKFRLPAMGLYFIKNNEDKFYAEFFPDGLIRFNTVTNALDQHSKDTLYYTKHLISLVRRLCVDEAAREEIIGGMGLSLTTALDLFRRSKHLISFNSALLNYIITAHVSKEPERPSISKYLDTHALSWNELAAPQHIDQSQWFYFSKPSSPIAELVKDQVFFWLSTVHKISDDPVDWYTFPTSLLQLANELIEHEAVSDMFVVTVVTAAAGLVRWALNEPIPEFSERFPDLNKSEWSATNTIQSYLIAFLQLVCTYQRWKKVKVMRILASAGKNTTTIEELRATLKTLDFVAIVDRYSAQSGAVPSAGKDASLLESGAGPSLLLDSLKKLLASPLVQLERLLLDIFKNPELYPGTRRILLLKFIDDEIDMAASLSAFLNDSFSEEPFRDVIPLVHDVQTPQLSFLELEKLSSDTVQDLPSLVKNMRTLAVFMLQHLRSKESFKHLQMILNKLDFDVTIANLWQWSLNAAFASDPLIVQLHVLTMELTRLYIHENIENRKKVLSTLPVKAFYPQYPQYIQLLKELDLLDAEGELAASLAQMVLPALESSRATLQGLKELIKQTSAKSKIFFSLLKTLTMTEEKVLADTEWELIVLLARYVSSNERSKWLKPIIEKLHAKSPAGLRKEIATLYVFAAESSSEFVTNALATLKENVTAFNSQSLETINVFFQSANNAREGNYILQEGGESDIAFLLEVMWEKESGLLPLVTETLPKVAVKPIVIELSKFFLAISIEPQLRGPASTLFDKLKVYFEAENLELTEEELTMKANVLAVVLPLALSESVPTMIPLPTPIILVPAEKNQLRPSLQKLCSEEEKTAELLRNSKDKIKKSGTFKTVTKETFLELEMLFPPKYFEDEYLQACEKAANLIVPELLTGKEETLIPVIETMLDVALHRGSDQITKDVLEIIVGIVRTVDAVRTPFLNLLKRRRYYMQIFALFNGLVVRHKTLKQLLSSAQQESDQRLLWEEDIKKNVDALIVFLSLFQYCCDGCFSPLQEFLRDQQEGQQNNINVITLITGMLTGVLADFSAPSEQRILKACAVALLESVSGPSSGNQQVICSYPAFLSNIVALVTKMTEHLVVITPGETNSAADSAAKSVSQTSKDLQEVAPTVLQLILALLEGRERNPEEINKVMESVDFDLFKKLAFKLAAQFNEATLSRISLGTNTEEEKEAFDLTIRCFIICFNTLSDESLADFKMNQFTKFVSSVEIEVEDPLTGKPTIRFLSFPVPPISKFLTGETAIRLLFDIDRESRQVKLDDFTSKADTCRTEMTHQQSLSKLACVKAITRGWKYYWHISFALCVVLNALLVLTVEVTDQSSFHIPNDWIFLFMLLGVGQMVASILGTLSFYIEYFYMLKTTTGERGETTEIENLPNVECPGSSLNSFLLVREVGDAGGYSFEQVIKAVVRVLYSVGAVLAIWFPFLYPFLLFQLINLNDSVVNILKSVTQRGSQLALTFLFAIISIYAFTLIAFFFLRSYYDPEAGLYCDTLAQCFLSTLNLGMRSGGGIGDAFGPAHEDTYTIRIVFDLMFYICITTVLMAIVFGLIVDTFSELRDERNSIEFDMNNVCLICGLSRSVIELKGEGWQTHILLVHNPFAYLYFLIHIKQLDINDCSGIEKIVKEKLASKDISFYPTTSRELGFEVVASE